MSTVFMALIALLILLEIIVRTLFGSSTQVASEYSGYFMVAMVLCGFAYTFREGAFIRINLLLPRLPQKAALVMDVFVALLGLAITLYALRYAVDMVMESYQLDMRADTMSETPFWIPQAAVPLGLGLLAMEMLGFIIRRITGDK